MIARLRANPRPLVFAGIAVALIIAFVVVVAPLFNTSGVSSAELAGLLPTHATLHHELEIDLDIDNTGVSAITPVCVTAAIRGGLSAQYGIFQGVDRESFAGGRMCGGTLSGQESISIRLFFSPTAPGSAHLTLAPAAGRQQVGPAVSTVIQVAA